LRILSFSFFQTIADTSGDSWFSQLASLYPRVTAAALSAELSFPHDLSLPAPPAGVAAAAPPFAGGAPDGAPAFAPAPLLCAASALTASSTSARMAPEVSATLQITLCASAALSFCTAAATSAAPPPPPPFAPGLEGLVLPGSSIAGKSGADFFEATARGEGGSSESERSPQAVFFLGAIARG